MDQLYRSMSRSVQYTNDNIIKMKTITDEPDEQRYMTNRHHWLMIYVLAISVTETRTLDKQLYPSRLIDRHSAHS